jgi:hypothetical protein
MTPEFGKQMLASMVRNRYSVSCYHWYHKDGSRCHTPHEQCHEEHLAPVLAWEDHFENLVTTVGLCELIDGLFLEAPAAFTWYCGLIGDEDPNVYAAGDTLTSHSGWTEFTDYADNRKAWTNNGAASSGATSNSSSKATFAINDAGSVGGAFLCTAATGTSGILFGAGDFTATRTVESGDTLTLQVDPSVAAA